MNTTKYAIIVAGGSGSRFGSTLPKQFNPLRGEPMLMQTIRAFFNYDNAIQIIVALPSEYTSLWMDLCKQYNFTIKHSVVEGGETRFDSVKNALELIEDLDGFVAVHDGARPLVTTQVIKTGFDTSDSCDTAIPVVPVTDSIRQLDRNGSHSVNRDSFVAVQTPQVFQSRLIKEAYNTTYSPTFTDDASVIEYRGHELTLYNGDVDNIKITHPADLKIAEMILSERDEQTE